MVNTDPNTTQEGFSGYKLDFSSFNKRTGNVAASLQQRERGVQSNNGVSNKQVLEEAAEHRLVMKHYTERACELPGIPRSTFLMVFSPDGKMVASTHGNHDVYVCDLASGKHVKTLSGHPRTPWCVSFHPSHPQLIASGCLGGQVRVWDLSGGSEVWTTSNETVIASIAFHPRDQLLVIATYNELFFWNWAQPQPYIRIQTNTVKEKVRFVSFDALGHKLITGISLRPPNDTGQCFQNVSSVNSREQNTPSPDDTEPLGRISEVHERIVTSYHNLVQRYDSLVRNYHRLFLSRSQTTTDRGTDPMEIDLSSSDGPNQARTTVSAPYRRPLLLSRVNPLISGATSDNISDNSDSEAGSNEHSLNLRSLSLENRNSGTSNSNDNNPENSTSTSRVPSLESNIAATETLFTRSIFGSLPSAFQPANNYEIRNSRPVGDQRNSRDMPLPNPFNRPSTQVRATFGDQTNAGNSFRYMLTTYVNRLHRYMENSIDETINFWERYDRMGRDPGLFQDSVLNDLAQHLHHYLEESERAVFSNVCRRSNVGNFPTSYDNDNEETNSVVINTILQSFGDIRKLLREAGPRGLNLGSEVLQTNSDDVDRNLTRPRRDSSHTHRRWNTPNQQSEARRIRHSTSSSRNELFSSEDSDSDWEMFRPLRLNIYRTRNWNIDSNQADPPPDDSNFPEPFLQRRIVLDRQSPSTVTNGDENPHGPEFDVQFSDRRFMIRSHNSDSRSNARNHQNSNENNTDSLHDGPDIILNIFRSVGYIDRNSSQNDGQSQINENASRPNEAVNSPTQQQQQQNGTRIVPPNTQSANNTTEPNQATTSGHNINFSSLRMNDRQRRNNKNSEEAYSRIQLGLNALVRHTSTLSNIWTSGSPRSPLRLLRLMWEDLRREMVRLQRINIPTSTPMHCYTRSSLARCQMLNQNQSRTASATSNVPSRSFSNDELPGPVRESEGPSSRVSLTNYETRRNMALSNEATARKNTKAYFPFSKGKRVASKSAARNCSNSSTSTETTERTRDIPSTSAGITRPTPRQIPKSYLIARHRDNSNFTQRNYLRARTMWTPALRRRLRTAMAGLVSRLSSSAGRLPSRPWPRPRKAGTTTRNRELYCTRDGIRTRARQILSIFFDIMMGCLGLPALEGSIIKMLRTLKRALSLTCLLLVPHMRDSNPDPPPARSEAVASEPTPSTSNELTLNSFPNSSIVELTEAEESSDPTDSSSDTVKFNSASKMWSDRVAIQISAANRNFSARAKNRKELYNQNRRLKLLHRSTLNEAMRAGRISEPPLRSHENNLRHLSAKSVPIAKHKLPTKPSEPPKETQKPEPSTSRDTSQPTVSSTPSPSPWLNSAIRSFRFRIRNYPLNRLRYLSQHTHPNLNINLLNEESTADSAAQPRDESQNSSDAETLPIQIPRFRFFTIGSGDNTNQENNENRQNSPSSNRVPLVQINDVPISDLPQNNGARYRRDYVRSFHMNHIDDPHGIDPGLIAEASCPDHRIQVWDITNEQMPDISNAEKNIVVEKCKIHNDASIDISRDGRMIVALLPAHRFRSKRLGIYSLEWSSLGQLLYTTTLEHNPVSVALSPCGQHLAVGLGSRRVTLIPSGRRGVMAVIFRLIDENTARDLMHHGGLLPVRHLELISESHVTSVNCMRWAPQPGQGLVYANNTGQLRILS